MQSDNRTFSRIIETAQKEFLQYGFREASLRRIVKDAGLTTGAFYGYFKNKEELFDYLAGEQYNCIISYFKKSLTDFSNLSSDEQINSMYEYTSSGMKYMVNYMYDNYTAFKLILCCSEGTKYSGIVHQMAELHYEATKKFTQNSKEAGKKLTHVNPTLEHMLTSGMISTFFEMIIHDIPREESEEYTSQLLKFYSAGWEKILEF